MSLEINTPNQIQSQDRSPQQASVENRIEEEASPLKQSNAENGTQNTQNIPRDDGVEYGAWNAVRDFVRAEEDTRKEVISPTEQIRLVLLGQAEAGKSTVISRVFDVPEEEVCSPTAHDRLS